MTVLNNPIVFNNSTGSDTGSSGCGPATAVPVMVQTSAGSNTATASPTTGYSAGDVMYIPDSSFTGRKFNVIASVGSGSLTFDYSWDDSSFGTSGYVGGKRATFDNTDSRRLFAEDTISMCRIESETDQSLTSPLGANGAIVRVKGTGTSHKTLTISGAGNAMFSGGWFRLQNFKLEALDSNPLLFSDSTTGQTVLRCQDCIVGDATNSFSTLCASSSSSRVSFLKGTVVQHISDSNGRIATQDKIYVTEIDNSLIKDCGNLYQRGIRDWHPLIFSIFIGNGSNQFMHQRYVGVDAYGCVYYNYGNVFDGNTNNAQYVNSCLFHTVANPFTSTNPNVNFIDNYEHNKTGTNVYTRPINELETLASDPCVDAAQEDFNLTVQATELRGRKTTL